MSTPDALQPTADRAIARCMFHGLIFIFAINADFVDELKRRLGSSLLVCDAQFESFNRIRQSIELHGKMQNKRIRPSRQTTSDGAEERAAMHAEQRRLAQGTFVLVKNADVGDVKMPSTETLIHHIEDATKNARRCIAKDSATFVMIGLADDRSLHVTSPTEHITKLAAKSNRKAEMQAMQNELKAQFGKGSHPLATFIQSLVDARKKDIVKSVIKEYTRYTEKMVQGFLSNYMYRNFIGTFAWKHDETNINEVIDDALSNVRKNRRSILVIHGPAGCGKTWHIKAALATRYSDLKWKASTTTHSFKSFSDEWKEDEQVVLLKVVGSNKGYMRSMLRFCATRIICLIVELTHPMHLDRESLSKIFNAGAVFARCEVLQCHFTEHIQSISLDMLSPECVWFMSEYMHRYCMLPSEADAVVLTLKMGCGTECISIPMIRRALEKMHASTLFDRPADELVHIQMAAQQTMQERSFQTGYSLHCSSAFQERLRRYNLVVDAAESNDLFHLIVPELTK